MLQVEETEMTETFGLNINYRRRVHGFSN